MIRIVNGRFIIDISWSVCSFCSSYFYIRDPEGKYQALDKFGIDLTEWLFQIPTVGGL
jgi:hypothetical protein